VYGRVESVREYLSIIDTLIAITSGLNFDGFRRKMESLIITFVEPERLKCTCSRFQKGYTCEHVLHTNVVLDERSMPLKYQDCQIGSGPVIGRPSSVNPQPRKKARHEPRLPAKETTPRRDEQSSPSCSPTPERSIIETIDMNV
jgi:hypothetical protein